MHGAAISAFVWLCVGAGCPSGGHGNANTGQTVGSVTIGHEMPDITMKDLKGRTRRLSDHRGKVVLVDVWASWCAPCKVELPMLDDMARRLRGDGVEVLAISIDQEEANMREFLQRRNQWRVSFFHDPAGQVADRLQPPRMPTSYIVDRRGVVRMVNEGFESSDAEKIERQLKAIAAAP